MESRKILWFCYFQLLTDFPFTSKHFDLIFKTLKNICSNFIRIDPIFVFHLIDSISNFICEKDRFDFWLQFCLSNPDNINLILKTINIGLGQDQKDSVWNLIIKIIYHHRCRSKCLEFWKIAISLAIERNDHWNVHKFFQMAISSMPYNRFLWEMLIEYERSINHNQHLSELDHFYTETLRMHTSEKKPL
ncbi:metaxin-1 [Sarcoptes scabiei]|nr:metaxin-1 [Sarcoptes scabiei]